MHEQTVTRSLGVDGNRPAWPDAVGRPEAQPDVTRTRHQDAVPDAQSDPAARVEASRAKDAAFPRSYAQFEMDKETQRLRIKIVDAETNEVIRVIPTEEVQRIGEELQALARRDTIGKRQSGGVGGGGEPLSGGGVDRYV